MVSRLPQIDSRSGLPMNISLVFGVSFLTKSFHTNAKFTQNTILTLVGSGSFTLRTLFIGEEMNNIHYSHSIVFQR